MTGRNALFLEMETVDSTNSEARRQLDAGKAGEGSIIWAHSQSTGRGRGGARWISPVGNLYFSLILQIFSEKPFGRNFVLACALCSVIDFALGNGRQAGFKWPNDVLADGKKLGGILIERHKIKKEEWLIAGIGVNCVSHPDGLCFPATNLLQEKAQTHDKFSLLSRFASSYDVWLQIWQKEELSFLLNDLQSRLYRLEKTIEIRLPNGSLRGINQGFDPSGELLISLPDGSQRKISSGEILAAS